MIPITAIMPLATMVFEIIKWIKESKDIDPADKKQLLDIIEKSQEIPTWEEL